MTELINLHNIYFLLIPVLLYLIYLLVPKESRKHKRYYKYSITIYNKLKEMPYEGQKINYLKKINPYVFEELILYSLKEKGYKVIRNKSYSNDGGIDGKFYIDNQLFLVQAKRYQNHINKKHVTDFERIVIEHKAKGIFCHTGLTGKGSKEEFNNSQFIDFYSGSKLLKLLFEKSYFIS